METRRIVGRDDGRKPKDNRHVLAILCSDFHLSDRPPLIRSVEFDWFEAMAKPLRQIRALASANGECPTLCAGDLFDRWNPGPALISFAMRELPHSFYCVCGQHDLRHHRLDSLKDTAFGVLVEAGRINYVEPGPYYLSTRLGITLHGFPWGVEVNPLVHRHQLDGSLHVALVHRYVWWKEHSYPGANKTDRVDRGLLRQAGGYDVIVVGDNHLGFLYEKEGCPTVLNCGCLFRRRSDELNYRPSVGLLWSDGRVERIFLDTSEDRYVEDITGEREALRGEELEQLIEDLKGASNDPLDFRDALRRALKKLGCPQGVQDIVLKSVGE